MKKNNGGKKSRDTVCFLFWHTLYSVQYMYYTVQYTVQYSTVYVEEL